MIGNARTDAVIVSWTMGSRGRLPLETRCVLVCGYSSPVSGLRSLRTSLDAEANGRETMLHQALSIQLDISSRSACVYRLVITDVLLQTPAAQELLPGGELSEQSWWP